MTQPKASLEELASVIEDIAISERVSLKHAYSHHGAQPNPGWERKAFVLESAAEVFRTMGSYPDKSRAFITELRGEAGNGR